MSLYNPCPNTLYIQNRLDFAQHMATNCMAIFTSNDVYPISADSTMPFEQHRDIFYLSGIDQPNSVLVLFPEHSNPEMRSILFVDHTDEHTRIWEGEKLSKNQAQSLSGVNRVYWTHDFEKVIHGLVLEADGIYLNQNEHLRYHIKDIQTREDRLVNWIKTHYPLHRIHRSYPILQSIRPIKKPEELAQIQTACHITGLGFESVLKTIKPNRYEFEIAAEWEYQFKKNRSRGFAYQPIVASGGNACVLHYTQNHRLCQDGELILMDVAAEYGLYSSDLTRCVPVNGRFNARQSAVYQSVLRVKNFAASILKPGIMIVDYNQAVGEMMTSELLALKLLDKADIQNQTSENPAYRSYFMHGTSHFLGLDTHDYGDYTNPIEPNMVLTIEPGIYIPKEHLGIRLEDDYLITSEGAKNLMAHIPIEINDIEDRMNA